MKNLPARATALVLSLIVCFVLTDSGHAEKIKTAIPSASIHYLSLYVAEEKGFFKDEGLENEVIAIGGPAGIAALVNGGIDFSGAAGSGMRAAMAGAPIKVIMFQTEKVTWYLVAKPKPRKDFRSQRQECRRICLERHFRYLGYPVFRQPRTSRQ